MTKDRSEPIAHAWSKRRSGNYAPKKTSGETAHLALALARVLEDIGPGRAARYGEDFVELVDQHVSRTAAERIADPLKPSLAELRGLGKTLRPQRVTMTGLDRRIGWLCGKLEFGRTDSIILSVMARWAVFDSWRVLMRKLPPSWGGPTISNLAVLSGLSPGVVGDHLAPGGQLLRSQLIRADRDGEYDVAPLFRQIARAKAASGDGLTNILLPQDRAISLGWEDFAHLGPIRDLAKNLIATREPVSILLFGEPGTGKTEFARSLAQQAGSTAVFAGLADEHGNEPDRRDRLAHLTILRGLCGYMDEHIIVVDEADDILAPTHRQFASKQWVNLLIEEPKVPTIWILNDRSKLDPAALRRMSLAIGFERPPMEIRHRIARRAAQASNLILTDGEMLELAALPANPALVASGMHVAYLTGGGVTAARDAIGSVMRAMDEPCQAERLRDEHYSPDLSCADVDLANFTDRLKAAPSKGWSLLLTGPSGTGKSAFARHIAECLNIEVIKRRPSDLISPFVGETESRIATAFARAADRGAMLLIDEIDSFLYDRNESQRSWERTCVNEILQQMERLQTPFVATSNFSEKLDLASLRRFTFRVGFRLMTRAQVLVLFQSHFGREWPSSMPVPDQHTPGDFAVVACRASLLGETRHDVLVRWLGEEITARGGSVGRIGFSLPVRP